MRFAIFPVHLSKVLRLPRKIWCQVIRSAAPVTQNHLSKPAHLILQNATPLKKSAPWPLNISHEHVSCTAPATENASLQILFKCPMLAIVSGNATKPSRFAHFWRGAQSLAPATRNDIWTSKSGADMWCFCRFWLGNVLRATTACTFSSISTSKSAPTMVCFVHFDFEICFAPQRRALISSSQLPKLLQTPQFLTHFTSKCASRHNAVHFFNISTSKSGPILRCFVLFHFEIGFAPQRRATFHLSSPQMSPHPPL